MSEKISDNKFSNNYPLMPDGVKFFLSNELSGDIIIELANKYSLKEDSVYSLVFLAVNSDFDLAFLKKKVLMLDLTGTNLNKFWLDFLGCFFLPIFADVKKYTKGRVDIPEELKKLGASVVNYQKYVDSLNKEIDKEEQKGAEVIMDGYKLSFDIKEESAYVLDTLSSEMINVLSTDSYEASKSLNLGIIYLLIEDETFKDKILRNFFTSTEMFGKNYLTIDEKKVEPTIANWFKDFIKQNGSDNFNDLLLIDYINKSANAKSLNGEEKKVLANLFRFYRNVSFFPDSMDSIEPSMWKIFPFNDPEGDREVDDVLSDGSRKVIKNKDIIEEKKIVKDEPVLIKKESEDLIRLRNLMNTYSPSSLERKAINEEIKKLKKEENK